LAPPQLPKLLGARGCYRGHCDDADGCARLLGQHPRHEQPVILVLAWQSTTAGRARAVAGPAAKPAAGRAPPTPASSRWRAIPPALPRRSPVSPVAQPRGARAARRARPGFGLGLVHRLARGRDGPATPIQLVLWLPGPSRVPALATIDDTVGPVAAVVDDALRLALDEVAAARDVNQRARNQHREQSPGADHRQPAGVYCHSLVCKRGPAARRAYTAAILTRNHVADAAASAAPKINNK